MWSPVVLGLKSPESDFEKSLEPRVLGSLAGVYVSTAIAVQRRSRGVPGDAGQRPATRPAGPWGRRPLMTSGFPYRPIKPLL